MRKVVLLLEDGALIPMDEGAFIQHSHMGDFHYRFPAFLHLTFPALILYFGRN